jgi:hypothetical protein
MDGLYINFPNLAHFLLVNQFEAGYGVGVSKVWKD